MPETRAGRRLRGGVRMSESISGKRRTRRKVPHHQVLLGLPAKGHRHL